MLPKKSLGQNFLTSPGAIFDIVQAADLKQEDIVLEIGPGKGVLTKELIRWAAQVVAVEKDEALGELLTQEFAEKKNFSLISQDILEFDPEAYGLKDHGFKIIANIPYYITGEILRKFLETSIQPSRMVLMVQKEVAERIVARDQTESILSMSVKAYGIPRIIATVKAGSFYPKPKVDSAILLIDSISRTFFEEKHSFGTADEKKFFTTVKKGFAHKRKFVKSNLETTKEVLQTCGIPPKSRPEDLSKENWLCLAINISNSSEA